MPALAFGLNSAKARPGTSKPAPKRKAVFDEGQDEDEGDHDAFSGLQKPTLKSSKSAASHKSPKPVHSAPGQANAAPDYTNLSALRSAKLLDEEASKVDASAYDYDEVYDTIHAPKDQKKASDEASGPKYMNSLLRSAEVRKRDQLRAKDKLLQRERDEEGDEFADKEKFVTEAYKKQQEENRRLEEEEERRQQEEDERRRRGGGMTEFNKSLLRKEEQRQLEIQQASEEAQRRRKAGELVDPDQNQGEIDENKMAAELNQKGGSIVVNDEGEVVDKRQLLGAGLNVAPKKPGTAAQAKKAAPTERQQGWRRSEQAHDARMSQRERQTRMIEQQIEEMAEKQRQAAEAEQKAIEEKNKSKVTEDAKMSAKERYLQRKKAREEQAKKAEIGG